MNLIAFSRICAFACGLGLLAAPLAAGATTPTTHPVTVKVQVNLPPSWTLLPGDQRPDFLAASLSDALAREGCTLPVAELVSVEDAAKAPYLLKIDIADWRMTSNGDFACTLKATLRTPQGEHQLGVYPDTTWAPGVIYANSNRAYYPTRREPIRELCRDLQNSALFSHSTA